MIDSLIKSAYSYIFDSKLPVWDVEIARCVDQIGNNFNAHHFYVSALRQYINNGYNKKTLLLELRAYYASFQPKTQRDVFKLGSNYNSKIFSVSSKDFILLPWEVAPRYRIPVEGIPPSEGCQEYGPVSENKCHSEVNRLLTVLHSIQSNGFDVNKYGPLFGQVLICSGRSKLLVHNGNHRAAVLCALNAEKLPYSFRNKYLRIIDDKSCEHWPMVAEGIVSKDEAVSFMEDVFFKPN